MIIGERKPWEDGIFHAQREIQTDRQTETKEI